MTQPNGDELDDEMMEMEVTEVRRDPPADGYEPVTLETTRGDVDCRYYAAGDTRMGAIFVGGAGGGWDTPVKGRLYPQLCQELQADGIAALRVKYRHSTELEESVLDVLAAIGFLESEGIDAVAVAGHSFGGAVVIQAAAHSETVRTCLPLSTQSYGAGAAAELGPHCSIFLAHGTEDEILAPACSEYVYRIARDPKHVMWCQGARHGLDECADELPGAIRRWINSELRKALAPSTTT